MAHDPQQVWTESDMRALERPLGKLRDLLWPWLFRRPVHLVAARKPGDGLDPWTLPRGDRHRWAYVPAPGQVGLNVITTFDQLEAPEPVLHWSFVAFRVLWLPPGVGPSCGPCARDRGDGCQGRPSVEECAEAYFVLAWMGRSAVAGTRGEERVGLALRYDAGGGDPVTRYRSAVESLGAWHEALRRCSFTREDAFGVVARLAAKPHVPARPIGVYCDPPWPDDGDGYLHVLDERKHARLAGELAQLPHAVVMRFGDHPLIRELYPAGVWTWHHADGRDQNNGAKDEVFLVRGADRERR